MRTVSPAIQEVLDAGYGETKDLVIITIPAQTTPSFPETVMYLANGDGITVDSQLYSNRLRGVNSIKMSLGHSPDNGEVVLENVSKELGLTLTDSTRILDGAEVVVKKAFRIADGSWEAVTIFVGQVRNTKVDQSEVRLTLSSDMAKRGTNIAQRPLTQRCIWIFNKNGSGVGPQCGWLTTMPGDATACDHDLDSVNGCKSHGNQARFGGVPSFTALTESSPSGGYDPNPGGDWGQGTGGGWCVHPETFILCTNTQNYRYWLKAYQVTDKDIFVTMDRFGKARRTDVKKVIKGTSTQIYSINTEEGYSLKCTPSHPIITDFNDDKGTAIQNLEVGDRVVVGTLEAGKFEIDFIKSMEILDSQCNVITFELASPYHIYVAGETKVGGILSHNIKWDTPMFPQYPNYQQ